MNRLCTAARGICSWQQRLANPHRQWKRRFSALETAVSWEMASDRKSGIPEGIEKLFRESNYGESLVMIAVAEHKVDLPGGNAASQSDVWAVVKTAIGMLSLTVEAKAKEVFGGKTLNKWLVAGKSEKSKKNRKERWDYVRSHLPQSGCYHHVRYQMLHRCAASVIEAKRLGFGHAAFVVQAFETPDKSFQDYAVFCKALEVPAERGSMTTTSVDGIALSVGWSDCPLATNEEIAFSTTKIK